MLPLKTRGINMSSDVRIYLNPKCTKCRLSMQLLDDNGINPDVVEYLNKPPTTTELNEILDLLGLEPRELMRQHEMPYKELNLGNESLSRAELIQAMVDNPILIERPIVIKGNKATIGRPPEKILDIL
jgi:arsenate reductase